MRYRKSKTFERYVQKDWKRGRERLGGKEGVNVNTPAKHVKFIKRRKRTSFTGIYVSKTGIDCVKVIDGNP